MNKQDLLKSEAIQIWLDDKTHSKNSRKNYLVAAKQFFNFVNETPEDAAEEIEEVRTNPHVNGYALFNKLQLKWEKKLKLWRASMKKRYVGSTIKVKINIIRSFFKNQKLSLSVTAQTSYAYIDKRITKDELQKLISNTKGRIKAFILFERDTGLRPSTICAFKLSNLREKYETEHGPVQRVFIPQEISKTDFDRNHFISHETMQALEDYFTQRRNGTNYIPPEELTPDSPLFRSKTREVKGIREGHIANEFLRVTKELGLNTEEKIGDRMLRLRLYCIRDYFLTICHTRGLSDTMTGYFIGHGSKMGVDAAYFNPSIAELLEQYEKLMPALITDTSTSKIKQLEEQVATLQHAFERARVESKIALEDIVKEASPEKVDELIDLLKQLRDKKQ